MKRKQGISLIVLIITIIVIVILATAVLLTIANNNPIENAKNAVEKNDEASIKEEAALIYSQMILKETFGGEEVENILEYIKTNLIGNYSEELKNRLNITEDGQIEVLEKDSVAMKLKYGDYVKYIDAEGDERLAAVLYESSSDNGLEIVLLDNLKEINVGSGLEGYNNARVGIQKQAEEEINTVYAVGARPLGGSTTNEYLYGSKKEWLGNYGIDAYINVFDITGIDDKEAFTSILENICNEVNGIPSGINGVIYYDSIEGISPTWFIPDHSWIWIGTYYDYCIKYDNEGTNLEYHNAKDYSINSSNVNNFTEISDTYFIPVIKLKNTVEIESGDGTYHSPYVMQAK